MNALIIFDISARESEVKSSLRQIGYWNSWTFNSTEYHLPKNTFWKPGCELVQAKSDIQNIIANLNRQGGVQIILQRCIIVSVNPWEGIIGSAGN